jgi:hypothetical protein
VSIGAVGLGLGLGAMMIVQGITYPARYTRAFDIRPLVAAAVDGLPPDAVVFGHPDLRLSYDIYLRGRPVGELPTEKELRDRLARDPRARVVIPAALWEPMAPSLPGWRVLASATLRDRPTVLIGKVGP